MPDRLAEWAFIYETLASPAHIAVGTVLVEVRRGFAPHEVDEMELWQVRRLLDIGVSDEDRIRAEQERENAERVAAAERGEEYTPPPSAAPVNGGMVLDEAEADAALAALRKARADRKRKAGVT